MRFSNHTDLHCLPLLSRCIGVTGGRKLRLEMWARTIDFFEDEDAAAAVQEEAAAKEEPAATAAAAEDEAVEKEQGVAARNAAASKEDVTVGGGAAVNGEAFTKMLRGKRQSGISGT